MDGCGVNSHTHGVGDKLVYWPLRSEEQVDVITRCQPWWSPVPFPVGCSSPQRGEALETR